jgi:hypothetical protein
LRVTVVRTPRREIPSLSVRCETATIYPTESAETTLAQARADFPDYALEIEPVDGGVIIKTAASMRVPRWLRA